MASRQVGYPGEKNSIFRRLGIFSCHAALTRFAIDQHYGPCSGYRIKGVFMVRIAVDLTIGTLAKRSACNVETIRYYERIGLLPPPQRSANGYRVYGADAARRLGFIRRCRELGFSLDDVRMLLGLIDGGRYSCDEVKKITLHHRDAVRAKILDLRRLERSLSGIAADCRGGTAPPCPIIDALLTEA